jgi:hypothetical protein
MPSIFIWKAAAPSTSKKTIRFYSGSNWVLEDSDYSSKSYIYLEQIVISESDNSVITFHTKDMPQDWVGTELLEVTNVPYEMVKSDGYGTLEKLGTWMRFTSKNKINFEIDSLKGEFANIKKWINQKNKTFENKRYENKYSENKKSENKQNLNSFDPHKIQIDFQQFLIKYNVQPMPTNITLNEIIKPQKPKYNSTYKTNNNTKYSKT